MHVGWRYHCVDRRLIFDYFKRACRHTQIRLNGSMACTGSNQRQYQLRKQNTITGGKQCQLWDEKLSIIPPLWEDYQLALNSEHNCYRVSMCLYCYILDIYTTAETSTQRNGTQAAKLSIHLTPKHIDYRAVSLFSRIYATYNRNDLT